MEKTMRKLEKKAISNLIIDVRDNNGGWDIMGAELLSYLIQSPDSIQYYKRLHTITNDSEFFKYTDLSEADLRQVKSELRLEADSTFTLIDENTQMTSKLAPKPNAFRGKIYILMNGASQSTTSEFLALTKTYKVGTLIGSEAGGASEGGNGGSFLDFSLPNSKIRIHLPVVYYENAVPPTAIKGRGTMPDFEVHFQPADLLNKYDRRKEFAKDLIRKGELKVIGNHKPIILLERGCTKL
jgi:C-terminal processing protease CtpA/Prc